MSCGSAVPETKVLAIASHVVYGYVGNTMAVLVMQSMGCEVAALNTVQFSNHKAYKQVSGTKATAAEIRDLYDGLSKAGLNDFDVLLSGYAPGSEAVEAVGTIARDLRLKSSTKPGSFFWILDPVMGDQGNLYVDEDVVPAYKNLIKDADLILPNQFEAELLSGTTIKSLPDLRTAISQLHKTYQVPHVIITSVKVDDSPILTVVGSTVRSTGEPRLFKVDVPSLPCFFSGTGDMFAALMVARLREAVAAVPGLANTKSWLSPDDVQTLELPLAVALERVLSSMQTVLQKTKDAADQALSKYEPEELEGRKGHLRRMKATEVRLVRNLDDLKYPNGEVYLEALDV